MPTTVTPEVYYYEIDRRAPGGPRITIRMRSRVEDAVDGTTKFTDDDRKSETITVAWAPFDAFEAALLAAINDGRFGRNDIVFATPPEAP